MDFTLSFIGLFAKSLHLIMPLLTFFVLLIVALGQLAGRIEGWSRFNALYWSFITAFTVGYGDIRPLERSTKILSLLIALLGIMFTGIIVAITVATATRVFEAHTV